MASAGDEMTERPILFQSEMVRAYRREVDPKTQTRRMSGLGGINDAPDDYKLIGFDPLRGFVFDHFAGDVHIRCPYGVAGDRLICREAWKTDAMFDDVKPSLLLKGTPVMYLADEECTGIVGFGWGKYRPPMFLPYVFSRDTLEVISAVPQRLRDITEADARAEGVELTDELTGCSEDLDGSYVKAYSILWDSINGSLIPVTGNPERRARIEKANAKRFPWAKNPWVWKVECRRLSAESRGMR